MPREDAGPVGVLPPEPDRRHDWQPPEWSTEAGERFSELGRPLTAAEETERQAYEASFAATRRRAATGSHADRVRRSSPTTRSAETTIPAIVRPLVDQIAGRIDGMPGAHGRISQKAKVSLGHYLLSLKPDERYAFAESMEALIDAGEEAVVRQAIDDIETTTTTTTTTTTNPGAPAHSIPTASAGLHPPLAAAPATTPAAPAPASSPDAAAQSKQPSLRLPKPTTYRKHHECHLAAWLTACLLARETALVLDAVKDIGDTIFTELSKAHGANGQWGLVLQMYKIASSFITENCHAISGALHAKLGAAAKQCAKEGHISADDCAYINDVLVRGAIEDSNKGKPKEAQTKVPDKLSDEEKAAIQKAKDDRAEEFSTDRDQISGTDHSIAI